MKFDGVNSILRLYKMIEFDFPCVSRHFCRKSPEIHIRKKNVRHFEIQERNHFPCKIIYCDFKISNYESFNFRQYSDSLC